MLGSGFTVDELGSKDSTKIADYLQSMLSEQGGTVGFGNYDLLTLIGSSHG